VESYLRADMTHWERRWRSMARHVAQSAIVRDLPLSAHERAKWQDVMSVMAAIERKHQPDPVGSRAPQEIEER
jgi:hypothetical protein